MNKLLINEPPLQVLPTLAKWIGLSEAIALQQVHYWLINPKVGKTADGHKWVRNTVREWHESNFPFWTERTIQRIFKTLEEYNLIQTRDDLNIYKYDQTKWFTINYEILNLLDGPIKKKSSPGDDKMTPPDKMSPPPDKSSPGGDKESETIPETTSETTSENNNTTDWRDFCNKYESEIGGFSPIIAERFQDYAKDCPIPWMIKAVDEAAHNNVRKASYIYAIIDECIRTNTPPGNKPKNGGKSNGPSNGTNENQGSRDKSIQRQLEDIGLG